MKPGQINFSRAGACTTLGLSLIAVALLVALSAPRALAQRTGGDTARSAMTAPARSDSKTPPGQRMLRRVLREAFPKPHKQPQRPAQAAAEPATANAIPARNAIGLRVPPPPGPIAPASKPSPAVEHAVPNITAAIPPSINAGKLTLQPRSPLPPHVPAAKALPTTGINGTTMPRNNSGLSGIGGTARSVSGINGTTIRPKHPN